MKPRLAFLVLALSVLACGQYITPPSVSEMFTAVATTIPATPTRPPTQTAAPVATDEVQTATVKAAMVNVRQSPGGEVVGQIFAGQSVTVIGCEADWCQIGEPLAGWVFVGCLSIETEKRCEAK